VIIFDALLRPGPFMLERLVGKDSPRLDTYADGYASANGC
jgi:hypothetical protein